MSLVLPVITAIGGFWSKKIMVLADNGLEERENESFVPRVE